MNGLLALVGGGEFEPEMEKVDRFLLEQAPGERRVACLATAIGQDRRAAAALAERGVDYFNRLDARAEAVAVVDRESAMDERLAERIRASDILYLADGDARYLYNTLRETHAWVAIGDVIEGGGVVAGSGAGAAIFGEKLRPGPGGGAFNIFPGAVIVPDYRRAPHARLRWMRLFRLAGGTFLGIDRHTALLSADFRFTVVGRGRVTVWSNVRHATYEDGDPVLWP